MYSDRNSLLQQSQGYINAEDCHYDNTIMKKKKLFGQNKKGKERRKKRN